MTSLARSLALAARHIALLSASLCRDLTPAKACPDAGSSRWPLSSTSLLWSKERETRNGLSPEIQALEALRVCRDGRGRYRHSPTHPLSNDGDAKAVGLSWWLLEKWEGVRGRVCA